MKYKVLVVVPTYNHKDYIEQTLIGIISQQVDFPMKICVVDDCSCDGTTDIVRSYENKYPDLIDAVCFVENQYSQGKPAFKSILSWSECADYIALCEGDDYWIDSLKLKKQVVFMDTHSNCSLCFHSVTEHWEDNSAPDKVFFPVEDRIYSGCEIFKQWVIATASVMIRSSIFSSQKIREILDNDKLLYYDQAIYMYCALEGEICGISDVMAVYRRLTTGFTYQFHNNLREKIDIIEKNCLHNHTMVDLYGSYLGGEFVGLAQSRCVLTSFRGLKMSIKDKRPRMFLRFLSEILLKCPKEFSAIVLNKAKKGVVNLCIRYLNLDLLKIKSSLYKKSEETHE